jgi:hypothetical protein
MLSIRKFSLIHLIFIIFILGFFTLLFAQEPGFPWEDLGVSTGVIVAIITVVQLLKQYIPAKFVVFVPIILSAGAKFIVAPNQPLHYIFYWAAAAAYLWSMGNEVNLFKTRAEKKQ